VANMLLSSCSNNNMAAHCCQVLLPLTFAINTIISPILAALLEEMQWMPVQ
jgi:hypothetical protein